MKGLTNASILIPLLYQFYLKQPELQNLLRLQLTRINFKLVCLSPPQIFTLVHHLGASLESTRIEPLIRLQNGGPCPQILDYVGSNRTNL